MLFGTQSESQSHGSFPRYNQGEGVDDGDGGGDGDDGSHLDLTDCRWYR